MVDGFWYNMSLSSMCMDESGLVVRHSQGVCVCVSEGLCVCVVCVLVQGIDLL